MKYVNQLVDRKNQIITNAKKKLTRIKKGNNLRKKKYSY